MDKILSGMSAEISSHYGSPPYMNWRVDQSLNCISFAYQKGSQRLRLEGIAEGMEPESWRGSFTTWY